MICAGVPEQIAEMNAQAFSLTAGGDAEWVTQDVQSLLGRPARSLEQFHRRLRRRVLLDSSGTAATGPASDKSGVICQPGPRSSSPRDMIETANPLPPSRPQHPSRGDLRASANLSAARADTPTAAVPGVYAG